VLSEKKEMIASVGPIGHNIFDIITRNLQNNPVFFTGEEELANEATDTSGTRWFSGLGR
jgi:hypothetical protein